MIEGLLYTLDGHEPVPCSDVIAWAKWFETAERRVALDRLGPYEVSTVFLGLDYSFFPGGPPLVFETMVFGSDEVRRYATWDEAEIGHKMIVSLLQAVKEAP